MSLPLSGAEGVACHPNVLIGTYLVWIKKINSLPNNQLYDFVSHPNDKLTGAE
jgi:hypothetical protein